MRDSIGAAPTLRVLALARYGRKGASSRLRILQYVPHLASAGLKVAVSELFDDSYVCALYERRNRWCHAASGYWRRLRAVHGTLPPDLIWLEKEALPFLPASVERALGALPAPYVVDFDDAVFHRYDRHRSALVRRILGGKIDAVMRGAAVVVAGNEYIAERARRAGAKRVEILPTAVDLGRYVPVSPDEERPSVTIGWIGSPATARYLQLVSGPLADLQRKFQVRVRLIGSGPVDFLGDFAEVVPWKEENEVQQIASLDIGIMPLPNEPWERGKCGYKLIQYMAAGLPTVASPVGVNAEIVRHGETGFLARTDEEWRTYMLKLVRDPQLRLRLGAAGRRLVERRYCTAVTSPRLTDILLSAIGGES